MTKEEYESFVKISVRLVCVLTAQDITMEIDRLFSVIDEYGTVEDFVDNAAAEYDLDGLRDTLIESGKKLLELGKAIDARIPRVRYNSEEYLVIERAARFGKTIIERRLAEFSENPENYKNQLVHRYIHLLKYTEMKKDPADASAQIAETSADPQ